MLIEIKLPLDSNKFTQEDQILTLTGASWKDYQKLDSSEYKNYLISYLKNQIIIMSPGRNHERISKTIGILIEAYCKKVNLRYFPFGSTRLEEEEREGKEPDQAYSFDADKKNPDLAVEVNFTSGSINDLTKYNYLKIKEVWLWQNNQIKFYNLEGDRYIEVETSTFLPGIQSAVIIKYINRGLTESPLDIDLDWIKELDD